MEDFIEIVALSIMGICTVAVVVIFADTYMEKLDCELINKTECGWQMLPIDGETK